MATFSGELPQGLQTPTANVNRSWLTLGLNQKQRLQEDLDNQELMANNDFIRSISLQDHANAFSAQQAELGRQFNANEAQKNRDFQERMSNTDVIRRFNQYKKLGLNPVLAMQNSASVPSGSQAGSSPSPSCSSAASGRTPVPTYQAENNPLGFIIGAVKLGAGLYTSNAQLALAGADEVISSFDKKGYTGQIIREKNIKNKR